MDAKYIIQTGDIVKYHLKIEHQDFDMQRDEFNVTISWGVFGKSVSISKDKMLCDEEGNWFFVFESDDMVGHILATCTYLVADTDVEGGYREEVDRQYIGFATKNPCPRFCCECMFFTEDNQHVLYTRIYRSDANTLYLNLRTTEENGEHRPILDSEGKQLRARKNNEDLI